MLCSGIQIYRVESFYSCFYISVRNLKETNFMEYIPS